jgi:hypothetical protein
MSGGDLRHRVSGSMFGSRKQPEDGYGEGLDEKHALELAKQKMDEIGFKKAKEKLKLQMVIFFEDQVRTMPLGTPQSVSAWSTSLLLPASDTRNTHRRALVAITFTSRTIRANQASESVTADCGGG